MNVYIQMECFEKSLDDFLNEDSYGMDFDRRIQMAYEIIRGLKVLHETYKLAHRDLSLESIHISHDGTVKIGDLGWASECAEVIQEGLEVRSILRRHLSFKEFPKSLLKISEKETTEDMPAVENYSKLFMAPELEMRANHCQWSDMYSLGLILLTLFYQSDSESERMEVVRKCRAEGPPKDFTKNHKELAKMIEQMISIEPSNRPSIGALFSHPMFRLCQKPKARERSCSTFVDFEDDFDFGKSSTKFFGEFRVMLGNTHKWKKRYLNLSGEKLLVYKKKGDTKARMSYPLRECSVQYKNSPRVVKADAVLQKLPKRTLSQFSKETCSAGVVENSSSSPKGGDKEISNIIEVTIEHSAIETISVELFGTTSQRANWINCLLMIGTNKTTNNA